MARSPQGGEVSPKEAKFREEGKKKEEGRRKRKGNFEGKERKTLRERFSVATMVGTGKTLKNATTGVSVLRPLVLPRAFFTKGAGRKNRVFLQEFKWKTLTKTQGVRCVLGYTGGLGVTSVQYNNYHQARVRRIPSMNTRP